MGLLMHPRLAPVRRAAGMYSPARMALKAATDRTADAVEGALGRTARIDALADAATPADVLVVGVYVTSPKRFPDAVAELGRSRHDVRVRLGTMAAEPHPSLSAATVASGLTGGKFANANALIAGAGGPPPRWTLVIDHDARLPPRWLDRFVALAEAFDLAICQPALSLRSYYSHPLTRRRPWAVARETGFVEIGPVTAFRSDAVQALLPFAEDAGMGWGLDLHWPAVAREHGLRMGIVDAAAVGHEDAPFGASYSAADASAEAEAWLRGRPSVPRAEALRTLVTHVRVPSPASLGGP